VFHAHSLSFGGFAVSIFGQIFNKPSISKIAGGGGAHGSEPLNMAKGNIFKKYRLNYIMNKLDKVIAISEKINEDLHKINFPTNKILRINNGIDTKNYKNKLEWIENLSKNFGVYTYAGRFEKIKGIDILINAWYKTSEDFREKNRLLVMGQ